jgi:hypothetical protein
MKRDLIKHFGGWGMVFICAVVMLPVLIILNNTSIGWSGLIFLLCPAMHLLMHRGGHDDGHRVDRRVPMPPGDLSREAESWEK